MGRQFAGTGFQWATPFALLTGAGLVIGYALIGACWLVMKTEGPLHEWARRKASLLAYGVAAFIAMVSVWTPLLQPQIFRRWFDGLNLVLLSPVPVLTIALFAWLLWALKKGRDFVPFVAALGLFAMCYLGLGISILPMIVPYTVTLWGAASSPKSQAFLMIGTLFLLPIIVMYTGWSYWVFRGKVQADRAITDPRRAARRSLGAGRRQVGCTARLAAWQRHRRSSAQKLDALVGNGDAIADA